MGTASKGGRDENSSKRLLDRPVAVHHFLSGRVRRRGRWRQFCATRASRGSNGDDVDGNHPWDRQRPNQRQREPERADCHRMVRVWRRFVIDKPHTNRQPGDRIREGTLIDQCDTCRTEDRNDLLLPCRGFQLGRDGERDDRKFRHVVDPSDGHHDNFRSRDRQCRYRRIREPERTGDYRLVRVWT